MSSIVVIVSKLFLFSLRWLLLLISKGYRGFHRLSHELVSTYVQVLACKSNGTISRWLYYGYRPANQTTVGVSQKAPNAANYVQMREMLAIAKVNTHHAMDKAKSCAHDNRSFREFEKGDKVFLKVSYYY